MGIYRGVAFFTGDFPITLPRLSIEVNWVQHRSDERRPIKVRVVSSQNDDESETEHLVIEGDIPIRAFDEVPMITPDADMHHAVIHIALAPYVAEKPSTLKVRAMYGDEEYKLGRLRMERTPTENS
jgi:hypothetical protein